MVDVGEQFGNVFGFGSWKLGIGTLGNFFLWFVLSLVLAGFLGFFIYRTFLRKSFKHKIRIYGLYGNAPMLKWVGVAREIPVGRAGDKLFFLRKKKKYLPPPTIQMGRNEWWYWEREDGELINIGLQNLDDVHRRLGVKFIDTDMRMQRLGIEKNLTYRLQKQTFWEKYGQTIMAVIYYLVMGIMMIILFMQWRKTGQYLNGLIDKAADLLQKVCPSPSSSGVVPAAFLGLGNKFMLWRKWK